MADTRVVPSGKVYRQMFDAQVQLSRTLQASRRGRLAPEGPDSGGLPSEASADTSSPTHTTGRYQLLSAVQCNSITEQQCHVDVRGLPDEIVTNRPSSDIIERLREKRESDHRQAVELLYKDLSVLSQDYEVRYRQACGELLSYLSEQQQRLDNLMDGMVNTEHLQHFTLQELYSLWDMVSEETTLKKRRIRDLDRQLTGYESDRANAISLVLRKYSRLLEKISFLLPPDLHRLLDTEAMMINQALLANRRSVSRLMLHLLEAELQQESALRFRWEEHLVSWRRSQVNDIIDGFRDQTSSDAVQKPSVIQQTVEEMRTAQHNLLEQCCHVIQDLCSLAPPTCSTSLVADWFDQLTAVNQTIDGVNVKYLQQLTFYYEGMWQSYLTEMEHSKVALNALGLSEEEVQDIVSSNLLSLIGHWQSQAEQRLAALDREFETLAEHARSLSRSVCAVIRGVALLWETHRQATETTDQELQQLLDTLRHTQQQEVQKKESQLDVLLDRLRQESTEDGLRNTLDKSLNSLDDIKQSYSRWFSELGEVVDCYPVTVLEQLTTYSTAFSQYYNLNNTHTLSSDELHALYPSINIDMTGQSGIETQQPMMTEKHPIGSPNPAKFSPDWLLPEARSCLAELYDSVHMVTFTSSGGGAYSGPAFKCPAHKPTADLEQEGEFVPFPVEQLSRSLTRFRALCVDHVEQRFHQVLSSAVATVAGRREALRSEHDSLLKLQEQRKQHIQMDIHDTRAAELMLHRDRVESHCQLVLQELTSCRNDFLFLQTSIDKTTEDFRTQIYNMEEQFMHARTSDSLVSLFSSLQDRLDKHLEVTQSSQKVFRQSVLSRLNQLRNGSSALLKSFRLFSEGGTFSPKEVQSLLRRLEKTTKRVDTTEETLKTDMEVTESKSIGQAKEAVSRFEEKFDFLTVELKFQEKIQNVLTNTQVIIKTEVANNNSQKTRISSRLQELKTMRDRAELSSEEVCSFLSSVSEEIRARCRYLDCFLDPSLSAVLPQRTLQGSFALAARPKSSAPPAYTVLEPCRRGVACSDDAALGVVKHLNRMCRIQDIPSEPAENDQRRAATTSPGQKSSSSRRKSASGQSMKRLSKPNRKDPRFLVFGNKPSEQTAQCFKSIVNNLLWKANDVLLLVAEDFYKQATHQTDSFEACADQINNRLLGYKHQVNLYYNISLQEFREQLCVLEEGVCGLPRVLFLNHTQQHVTALLEQTAAIRQELDRTIRTSMETQRLHVSQLSVRLSHPACEKELSALRRREDDRQTQLAGAINRTYQELQECVRDSGEEFVKTLASLAEKLLFQMDNLLTVDQMDSLPTGDPMDNLLSGDQLNTGETEPRRETVANQVPRREEQQRGSRTWPGVSYLSAPADSPERHTPSPVNTSTTASPVTMPITTSPVTTATASITTAKSSLGHLAVIEHRDAQLQLFEEVYRSELLCSQRDRDGRLTELQRWTKHWTQQIHTLTQLNAE